MNAKPNIVLSILVIAAAAIAAATLMPDAISRNGRLVGAGAAGLILVIAIAGRIRTAWLTPALASLAVPALGLAVYGGVEGQGVLAALGAVGVIIVGLTAVLAAWGSEIVRRLASPGGPSRVGEAKAMRELMQKIHDNSMLSDMAKRVLFRERELELLRHGIERDIGRGDYNAALRLTDDMAQLFGYREEAESFRTRIERQRREDYDAQVHGALEELDDHLHRRDWAAAHDVAGRIRRLFPDASVVHDLDGRIARARLEHKRQLEQEFREAATRQDTELAMHKLRELDRYLTREESAALAEIATEVVARHRENLSVQFKLAVNDHRWSTAARIGEAIMAEFPNTKMAGEVRSMIDVLRTRATQAAVAGEG